MINYNRRIWLVLFVIFMAFVIIEGRLFYLQIIKHEFYKKKSKAQQERIISVSARRGDILDRNGMLLATSLSAYSVYADTFEMKDISLVQNLINQHLNLVNKNLLDRNSHFIWVKRKAMPDMKEKLNTPGIHFIPDIKRVYPNNESAGQLLGFVSYDDEGLSGLEHSQERILKGSNGKMIIENDPMGRNIYSYNQKIMSARNGKKVKLTIDKNIQFFMENELKKAVTQFEADSGTAIIMDLNNGEILGMANYPMFNPNQFYNYPNPAIFQNQAVAMAIEPGSIMKLFTMASAFEEKIINLGDKLFIPDVLIVGGSRIEEAHKEEASSKDISEILVKSLNVGAAMVGLQLGKQKSYKYLSQLEFGKKTNINLPGENPGMLNNYNNWREVDLSRISFGYTISATPIQLLKAISVFGNDGYLVQPRIFYDKNHSNRRYKRVYSEETVKKMLFLMQKTVDEGTGELTKIDCFTVGGKTGTARRFSSESKSYVPGSYYNSFAGIFPISKPKFSMIVVIANPRTNIFASQTAVPVFKGIAQHVLRYYNIAPDNLPTANTN